MQKQQLVERKNQMSEDNKPMKIVFAPGCFDGFEGTQEELDKLIADITQMAESGELFEKSVSVDIDDLSDEELRDIAENIGQADKRKLQ